MQDAATSQGQIKALVAQHHAVAMPGEQGLVEHQVGQAALAGRQSIPIEEGDSARGM